MSDDGSTKDDVKLPEGEVRTKITKLFTDEGKDTSKESLQLLIQYNIELYLMVADVIVLTAMGEEAVVDAKEAPRGS